MRGDFNSGVGSNFAGINSPFGVRPLHNAGGRGGGCGFARLSSGTPQAQIEAAGVTRIQEAELLHRGQGGAVSHLHCARTESDRRGFGGGQG